MSDVSFQRALAVSLASSPHDSRFSNGNSNSDQAYGRSTALSDCQVRLLS